MATQPSAQEPDHSATSESDAADSIDDQAADRADVQARFRAALERKRSRSAAGARGTLDDPKMHATHGAAGGRRVFRRKSG